MRYFFHVRDGALLLDSDGLELSSHEEAHAEAVNAFGTMISRGDNAVKEDDWTMWVTDQPDGGGTPYFTLNLSAKSAAA